VVEPVGIVGVVMIGLRHYFRWHDEGEECQDEEHADGWMDAGATVHCSQIHRLPHLNVAVV
jgi:hypothetical protein